MKQSASWIKSLFLPGLRPRIGALAGLAIAILAGCQQADKSASAATATPSVSVSARASASTPEKKAASSQGTSIRKSIGFRSRQYLDDHFAKHGGEFRGLSEAEYLLAAQTLRDSPVGGDIEEIVRSDGAASRFDKATGAFIAFNRDGTIRTFFKPNDGERYFRRQAQRSH